MNALVTALAILAILIALAGTVLRKPDAGLPKWYFWALAVVTLSLAFSVVYKQLS